MAHDNSEHLQFDSRLAARKGWISTKEREKMLAALPDLSHKVEYLDAEEPAAAVPAVDAPGADATSAVPASAPSGAPDEPVTPE
jgi:hypothetical protein